MIKRNLSVLYAILLFTSCNDLNPFSSPFNIDIEVADIQITGVEKINIGEIIQFGTEVSPTDATNQTISWTTDDSSIATVDADGVVTAKSSGFTTIYASATDGSSVYDQINLQVVETLPIPVESITISGFSYIDVGESTQLNAIVNPSYASNSTVFWSVSLAYEAHANVDHSSGLVTAIKQGSVTIRATAEDGSGVFAEYDLSITDSTVSSKIVVDHEAVMLFDNLSDYWINEAKKSLIILPGESHGRGYGYGLELLEAQDGRFNANTNWSGVAKTYMEDGADGLRWNRAFLDGGSYWNGSCGEEDFWTNIAARENILAGLQTIESTYTGPILFGFGWCWDMERNSATTLKDTVYGCGWSGSTSGGPDGDLPWGIDDDDNIITGNSLNLGDYLEAVVNYNISSPGVKTIFTTGPVDTYRNSERAYQRHLKNSAIRTYVHTNGGILFDYADILSWDYENNQSPGDESWTDEQSVVHTWRGGNTALATGGIGYDGGDGGCHISSDGCMAIGKALWVMAAFEAGWDGYP